MSNTRRLTFMLAALALLTAGVSAHEFTFTSIRYVPFTDGFFFPMGGVNHAGCYVHPSGYITFGGTTGTDTTPTVPELLTRTSATSTNTGIMRIAPLWTALTVAPGNLKISPLSPTSFRIAWNNVVFTGSTNTATFSMTLNTNGTFSITYGTVTPTATALIISGFSSGDANTTGAETGVDLSTQANWGTGAETAIFESFPAAGFDLSNTTLNFAAVLPASGLLSLADDDGTEVDLGFRFPFYGNNYRTAWIASNGNINFTLRSTFVPSTTTPNLTLLNDVARICPFWVNLNPATTGTLQVTHAAGSLTVAWNNVSENGATNANTFSVTLNSNGTFAFNYGAVVAPTGTRTAVVGATGGFPVTNGTEAAVVFTGGSTNGTGVEPGIYQTFSMASPFGLSGSFLNFNAFTLASGLCLTDDSTHRIDFPPGFSFQYSGTTYTTAFVNSNGSVSFVVGDTSLGESIPAFLSGMPKLAVTWDDYNPRVATGANPEGVIQVTEAANSVTVSWNVAQFGTNDINIFSITLNNDGTFSYSYGQVDSNDSLVGYTSGGLKTLGTETGIDLSTASPLHRGTETAVFELFIAFDLDNMNLNWNGSFETIFKGRPQIGTTMPILLGRAPFDGGLTYVHALAFGSVPGIPVDTRNIPLNLDPLLTLVLFNLPSLPGIYANFLGSLDVTGEILTPSLTIPNDMNLVGFSVVNAWLTLHGASPSGIRFISRSTTITIQS